MHIPQFPPLFREWQPGDPFKGLPPLPRWAWNPWLEPEQRETLMEEFGRYSVGKAEAFISPKDGIGAVRKLASEFYGRTKARYGIVAAPVRKRQARVPREGAKAPVAERVRKPGTLTPELEEELIGSVLEQVDTIIERRKRLPNPKEQEDLILLTAVWAEDQGVKISKEKAAEIAKEALRRRTAVKTRT